MASTTIKTTYSLDPATVRSLNDLARRWGVSRSEALRRLIRTAAEARGGGTDDPLALWDRLQRSVGLTPARARAWGRRARAERRSSSRKAEGGRA